MTVSEHSIILNAISNCPNELGELQIPTTMREQIEAAADEIERLTAEVSDLQFKIECEATISRTKIEKLEAEVKAAFKAGYSTGWELGRGHGTEFYPDEALHEWETEERYSTPEWRDENERLRAEYLRLQELAGEFVDEWLGDGDGVELDGLAVRMAQALDWASGSRRPCEGCGFMPSACACVDGRK